MNLAFEDKSKMLVQELGLCVADDVTSVEKLTGGVASDIAKISYHNQSVCVKFALSKLKVKEDWFAPAHRGRAEYAWLQMASTVAPGTAPTLHGWSDKYGGFAMEFLGGDDIYLWKKALLDGLPDQGEAADIGRVLGQIHAASTHKFNRIPFKNADDFSDLRLDPYLRFTAKRHPQIAKTLLDLADALYATDLAVVHGDVSPKNIFIRSGKPIILDAECATMGDPSFDIAFCLNHLVLKSIHLPQTRRSLRVAVGELWAAYAPQISWEAANDLEARVVALLPALMLARVDGKSPVEYLSRTSQDHVRIISVQLVQQSNSTISEFLNELEQRDQ